MEETITIKELFNILKKRWLIIVLTPIMIGLTVGLITHYLLTPFYQASTQILVNQKNSEVNMMELSSNVDLINTYSVIIKSPAILDKVNKELNLLQPREQLTNKIAIDMHENSQVFSVTVEDEAAERAVDIANAISEIFQREIVNIMNVDNVNILAKAELVDSQKPISPNALWNITVAIVVGMMVGIGIACLLEYLDNTIKDGKDVEKYLGLPVLGSIENISVKKGGQGSKSQTVGGETLES
ncbi:capsular polysaccharide biosynthesis protein [Cytobacillus eiseniae]|uniref:Capsular polysaccharide biosynthesis protein n=1 Tax=Cytobacillus eiseniae TaxID=762947 RepID=A0ABS4RHH0_9BACI|nr:Wzz/FepE/Etk N-terminal domain-containing protein [Cytobacillus eiseniae]MBP2241871.1 capsular polysaccharide biosynthesis protein [Cytobacillus eiseniae]